MAVEELRTFHCLSTGMWLLDFSSFMTPPPKTAQTPFLMFNGYALCVQNLMITFRRLFYPCIMGSIVNNQEGKAMLEF